MRRVQIPSEPTTLNPKPKFLQPKPYTPHLKQADGHRASSTNHIRAQTLKTKPKFLNPKPHTAHPEQAAGRRASSTDPIRAYNHRRLAPHLTFDLKKTQVVSALTKHRSRVATPAEPTRAYSNGPGYICIHLFMSIYIFVYIFVCICL